MLCDIIISGAPSVGRPQAPGTATSSIDALKIYRAPKIEGASSELQASAKQSLYMSLTGALKRLKTKMMDSATATATSRRQCIQRFHALVA